MRKIYALIVTGLLVTSASFGQQPEYRWAGGFGGPGSAGAGDEFSSRFVVDSQGNIYITGTFTGTTDFDMGPGTQNLTSNGDSDIFVAKYSKEGYLMWDFSIGGTGLDEGLGIALHNDLLYITGYFSGSNVEFDPILGGHQLTSNGLKDIFIANFDTTGFLIWVNGIGAASNDIANSIAVDDSGGVYITGSFCGTVDFDPGAGTANLLSGGSPSDAFIAKYSGSGIYKWAKDFGGGTTADYGTDVATDDSGNVYITGQFQGSNVNFDPPSGTALINSHGSFDAYVASYDSLGHYRWAFNLGGSQNDKGNAIAIDKVGDVLVTGRFTDANIDFDPGTPVQALTSAGGNDVYLAKYTRDGLYSWARRLGSANADEGYDITFNPYNNWVVLTGLFSGSVDFDPSTGTHTITSYGSEDIFVASYDEYGAFKWAFNDGGMDPDNGACVVSYLDNDTLRVYLSGSFTGTSDFDPTAAQALVTSNGGRDLFLAQYMDPFPVGIPEIARTDGFTGVYPNPANDHVQVDFKNNVMHARVIVSDIRGRQVRSFTAEGRSAILDVSGLDAGLYQISLYDESGVSHATFSVTR